MPYLESSWTTVFWAKLRKAAQKFIHTEGFQLLRSFLMCSNISMVGKVLREQAKPSGLRKPATTFGTPKRND